MADFEIPDKTQLTSVDRGADSLLIYDNDAQALKRSTVNNLTDLTSHPVGIDDVQTLTNKTITAPTISSPVLSGTVTGTYTLGGTPTFPSSVVTLTGSQTLTNKTLTSPAINTATIANPTLTVDSISEYTSAAGVTIDGVLLKDGAVGTNNVVTASITDSAVTTAKIADANVTNAKLATGAGEPGGAWTSWTPTLTNLSGGTTTYAKYTKVGRTVHFRFRYTLAGAGVSGVPRITLPVTANADLVATDSIHSSGQHNDATGFVYSAMIYLASTSAIDIYYINASGQLTAVSSTAPFTWASGDKIVIYGSYEAAS